MKAPINLKLAGAKTASVSTRPGNGDTPTHPIVAPAITPADEGSKLHATITKSWISGGIVGTDKGKVSVVAVYPAVKDTKTGAISLGASSFALTITHLDTNVSAEINPYDFSNTEWMEIPAPDDPADIPNFHVTGEVKIDVQASGKMMRVRFHHHDSARNLADIGYVFALDIPANTPFKPSS
ncbi:hypothetical protein [Pararhizobium sp.]|uniref:hypothetical protein n=1 Tax=Pararhizobium sp. TaxID=1977563 RepID=UPI00271BB0EB|nr:hypothetical protein [Pararhizobium sp.]MDO9418448.1 hypothetical protein [Pararhizobium sp.]